VNAVEIVNADPHSSAGTLRAVLDKLAAWLALTPADLERVGVDTSAGAALLLVPAEIVSPERFDPKAPTGRDEERVVAVFNARPVWVSLGIALVPSAEFSAAFAVWRLDGLEALRARWPHAIGG
jgi:hypothetical protein